MLATITTFMLSMYLMLLKYVAEMPQVVGCIDGTHIPIQDPHEYPDQYINRDGNFSMNVQIVVNHCGAITHLSSRWPGSLHDSCILQESSLHEVLDSHKLGPHFLIGDSGYVCQSNLLTPYPVDDTEEKVL